MSDPGVRPPADDDLASPLARFRGERPPAPDWFARAVAVQPERSRFDVAGAAIELLTWGERGRPGLLFLHGNGAHADWWRFIAPFFAKRFRCAAISWSGMGGSDWREAYSLDLFADEALAAAHCAGLFEAAVKPVLIAHSFGGAPAMWAAARDGRRLGALIVVDSGVRPPSLAWKGPPSRNTPNRLYPTLEAALGRFRLAPPQPCANLFLVDDIARRSVRQVSAEGEAPAWTWRFDPFLWSKLDLTGGLERTATLAGADCPIAFVWGEGSGLMTPEVVDYTRAHAPAGSPFLSIPEADHHVMLDQPLALVAALRALLAGWVHTGD